LHISQAQRSDDHGKRKIERLQKMRILHVSALAALSVSSIALRLPAGDSHLVSNSTNAPHPQNVNTTEPPIHSWPATPWSYAISPTTSVAITHYGRHICFSHIACQNQIEDDINEIGWRVLREYVPGPTHAYSFSSRSANFFLKQESEVERDVVLGVLSGLAGLIAELGTVEVVAAGVMVDGEVVARFMLTFPGI